MDRWRLLALAVPPGLVPRVQPVGLSFVWSFVGTFV